MTPEFDEEVVFEVRRQWRGAGTAFVEDGGEAKRGGKATRLGRDRAARACGPGSPVPRSFGACWLQPPDRCSPRGPVGAGRCPQAQPACPELALLAGPCEPGSTHTRWLHRPGLRLAGAGPKRARYSLYYLTSSLASLDFCGSASRSASGYHHPRHRQGVAFGMRAAGASFLSGFTIC